MAVALARKFGFHLILFAGSEIPPRQNIPRTRKPFADAGSAGALLIAGGVLLGLRFLWFFVQGNGAGKVQSLILAAVLTIVGFQIGLIGLIADSVSMNRKLQEEVLYHTRQMGHTPPAGSSARDEPPQGATRDRP